MADYLVHSFTSPNVFYCVSLTHFVVNPLHGGNFDTLTSCLCCNHNLNGNKCKYLFLASRITSLPIQPLPCLPTAPPAPPGALLPPADHGVCAPALPPDGAISVADAKAEKRVLIECVQKEVDAVTAQVLRLVGMLLKDVFQDSLLQLDTIATCLCRDLSDVITGVPLYAFQM